MHGMEPADTLERGDFAPRTLDPPRIRVVPAKASSERDAWLEWLDDGLRGGRRGRLRAEYGPLLDDASVGVGHHVRRPAAGAEGVDAHVSGVEECDGTTPVVAVVVVGRTRFEHLREFSMALGERLRGELGRNGFADAVVIALGLRP